MALLILIIGMSNGVVGVVIDELQMTIQPVILWMSGLHMASEILWIIFLASGTKLKKS